MAGLRGGGNENQLLVHKLFQTKVREFFPLSPGLRSDMARWDLLLA